MNVFAIVRGYYAYSPRLRLKKNFFFELGQSSISLNFLVSLRSTNKNLRANYD